jgi:hypothetical protein
MVAITSFDARCFAPNSFSFQRTCTSIIRGGESAMVSYTISAKAALENTPTVPRRSPPGSGSSARSGVESVEALLQQLLHRGQ